VYVAVRALGVLALYVWTRNVDADFAVRLSRADGGWYLGIAARGYDTGAGDGNGHRSNMAFFPLFPALVAGLESLTWLGVRAAGIAVAWAGSVAAAWGIFAVGAHVAGRRVGILLTALWGVVPHAIVQQMPYTEGLFTALAAWTLLAVLQRRWVTAGVLCLAAGLTRPTAVALIAVVGLAAFAAMVQRRDGWRPWVAAALAPLGWLAYLLWVGARTGRVDGWFHIQNQQWKMSFDGGGWTFDAARAVLARESAFDLKLVTLTLVAAIALLALSVIDRQPWPLLLYSGLLLAMALGGVNYYNARARFLLPAFALLLPAAAVLAKAGPRRAGVVISTLAVISAYVGCYLLLIWRFSP
jgi:hypothetical protein